MMSKSYTKLVISIEHRNLPRDRGNILIDPLSEEEILAAIERFECELPVVAGDEDMCIVKLATQGAGRTDYEISSCLARDELIYAMNKTLGSLNIGGIVKSG